MVLCVGCSKHGPRFGTIDSRHHLYGCDLERLVSETSTLLQLPSETLRPECFMLSQGIGVVWDSGTAVP